MISTAEDSKRKRTISIILRDIINLKGYHYCPGKLGDRPF